MFCLNCIFLAHEVHPPHLRKAFFTPKVIDEWKDFYYRFYSKEESEELERRLAEEEELTLSMERETQAITHDLPETVVSTEEEQPTTAAQLSVGKRRKKKKGKQGKQTPSGAAM